MLAFRNFIRGRASKYSLIPSESHSDPEADESALALLPTTTTQNDAKESWDPGAGRMRSRSGRWLRRLMLVAGILGVLGITAVLIGRSNYHSAVDPASASAPMPDPEHELDPAPRLARLAVDSLYARQSTSLAQASARYSLRNKRPPPPNYDRWYQYTQDQKCLVDDYEQIHRDFKPFYQLAEVDPLYFQKMIDRASSEVF
jgi:hypothetical protein